MLYNDFSRKFAENQGPGSNRRRRKDITRENAGTSSRIDSSVISLPRKQIDECVTTKIAEMFIT